MPRYMVTVDGFYSLETEVEADNEDQAIAQADFIDVSCGDILDGGTWGVWPISGDEE